MKRIALFLAALIAAVPLFAADTFVVDKTHSSVNFKIRHLVANVTGSFNTFDGTVTVDSAKPAASSVEFTIDAASVDTANEKRDGHLRSADFFDVAKYPQITFKSTKVEPTKTKNLYNVTGNFTMHGVTKQVTLPVQLLGFGPDGRGGQKAGFEIETTLDRKEYGITWNNTLDEGGVVLGDDVKVSINLEMNRKK